MNDREHILIFSDSKSEVTELENALRQQYQVTMADEWGLLLPILQRHATDLVLLFFGHQPNADQYLNMINDIIAVDEDVSVLLVVAQGDVKSMVRVAETGAFYFWTGLPLQVEEVKQLVHEKLEMKRMSTEFLSDDAPFGIIGKSGATRRTLALINKVKDLPNNVLITGESGTGKELIAHALHFGGIRSGGPFEVVNCAAIPANLIESELFGHVKGAFTGAYADRKGKFEMSNRGTLFLDEIGEIDLPLQSKLLRVIEDRRINPVGSPYNISVDTRIVAATNRNLENMVEDGRFRDDLYFRLNVITIFLQPLRQRREDIPLLVQNFLDKYAREFSRSIKGIEVSALNLLEEYQFPGNIRELQNIIQRAVILSEGPYIKTTDLPRNVTRGATKPVAGENLVPISVGESLDEAERKLILATLRHTGNNKQQASKILGITDRTLRNKLHQYQDEGIIPS
ncbi:MAG: sigma-54 interaction domain-containing protein [Methylocystaceae bacterium]